MHPTRQFHGSRFSAVVIAGALAVSACSSPAGPAADSTRTPASPSEEASAPSESPDELALMQYERFVASITDATTGEEAEILASSGDALEWGRQLVDRLAAVDPAGGARIVSSVQLVTLQDGTGRIEDCYRIDVGGDDVGAGDVAAVGQRIALGIDLERGADGWAVVSVVEEGPCVPSPVADELESRYVEFWDAVVAAGNPPDPDSARLAAVTAGEQLTGLRERLIAFRDGGREVRDKSVSHPEAVRLSERDTVGVVRDCRELDPDGGVYDSATGELVDGGAGEGQFSLWRTRLELVDGSWFVVDADLMEEDSECTPVTS